MSPLFARVHVALRRGLVALAVASALIPATALAVSSATEAPAEPEPPAHLAEAPPARTPASPRADAGGSRREAAPSRPSRSRDATAEEAPAPLATPAAAVEEPAAEEPHAEPPEEEADPVVPFAAVAGQTLVLPEGVRGVGFHESSDARALALDPIGTPTANLNAGRITLPPGSAPNEYMVLPSRGRANGPVSAVDIAVDHGVPVTAAVTGTVEQADGYRLYGRTHDEMVVLVPDDQPHLRVRILHIEGLHVTPGDRVEAGVTVLAATSRQLPFRSQIDRHAGEGPHVHIEVHQHDPEVDAPAEAEHAEG